MDKEIERQISSKDLIKSKKRVADHGEVFTPPWLVEAMLDLNKESDRIESRFLEPACGNGNFLTSVLRRKLAVVELKSKKNNHDKKYLALIAVMSIYGIELLQDNIVECRKRLLSVFANFMNIDSSDELFRAASHVLSLNLIHGDSLKMRTHGGRQIVFSEWEHIGKGKFKRRDFRFDLLAQASVERRDATPVKVYAPMRIGEIAHPISFRLAEVAL